MHPPAINVILIMHLHPVKEVPRDATAMQAGVPENYKNEHSGDVEGRL